MSKYVSKLAVQSASDALLWHYVLGGKDGDTLNIAGQQVPLWVVGAGLGVAGSLISAMVHDFVLPHISKNDRLRHYESLALAPAVSAGSALLLARVLHPTLPQEIGEKQLAFYSAVTEIASQWAYEQLVDPLVDDDYHVESEFQ